MTACGARNYRPCRRHGVVVAAGGVTVEIAFDTERLRDLCEDGGRAAAVLGAVVAEGLAARLADLRAVDNVLEMPVGGPVVSDDDRPRVTIRLPGGFELVCRVSHPKPVRDRSGRVDIRRVRRLSVVSVSPGTAL